MSNNPQQSTIASITNKSDGIQKTKLSQKFAFWYRIADPSLLLPNHQRLAQNEYENQVKKIAEFDTIEDFWAIFQHLRKPDSCKPSIEFQLFKDGIKPMWEDENNKKGGKLSIKLRKDYTTIIWEEMIFALIGDVLPKDIKENINGIVVSSKEEFNVLQIWFKDFNQNEELVQCIRDLLQIPIDVILTAKPFEQLDKTVTEIKKSTSAKLGNSGRNFKGKDKGNK
ncbi:MAG: eukaryotic translation initiation factor EIF4E family protein [archaeon]|nr:eukaryotic translation initiation factor EIF4E family protein [archaeon]